MLKPVKRGGKLLILILPVMVTSVLFAGSCSPSIYKLATSSPGNGYTLHLSSSFPYPEVTWLRILKNGREIGNTILSNGLGPTDRRTFGSEYPRHDWLSENIIRFSSGRGRVEGQCDKVKVYNDTDETIACMELGGGNDVILLIDLEAGAAAEVCKGRYHVDGKNVIYARWALPERVRKGRKVPIDREGVTSRFPMSLTGAANYCVRYTAAGIEIKSVDSEGEHMVGEEWRPTPRGAGCASATK